MRKLAAFFVVAWIAGGYLTLTDPGRALLSKIVETLLREPDCASHGERC